MHCTNTTGGGGLIRGFRGFVGEGCKRKGRKKEGRGIRNLTSRIRKRKWKEERGKTTMRKGGGTEGYFYLECIYPINTLGGGRGLEGT